MGKIIKIKQVATIEEQDWLSVYENIKQYEDIASNLGEEETKRLHEYIEEFRKYGMEVLETSNYVTFAEIKGEDSKMALVELDHVYTGKRLMVTNFFSEGEEAYVEVE